LITLTEESCVLMTGKEQFNVFASFLDMTQDSKKVNVLRQNMIDFFNKAYKIQLNSNANIQISLLSFIINSIPISNNKKITVAWFKNVVTISQKPVMRNDEIRYSDPPAPHWDTISCLALCTSI
jgi:uncharacterized HAD superfamily protein